MMAPIPNVVLVTSTEDLVDKEKEGAGDYGDAGSGQWEGIEEEQRSTMSWGDVG